MNATAERIEAVQGYTPEEHERWYELLTRQMLVLKDRACSELLEGFEILGVTPESIPNLGQVNIRLQRVTGWSIFLVDRPVKNGPRLCNEFAHRRFPVCPALRTAEHMDFAPLPDIFHDCFHLGMFTNENFASFVHALGIEGAFKSREECKALLRLYNRTGETGLIRTEKGLRIYGAACASSKSEAIYCLEDSTERLLFDAPSMMEMSVHDSKHQPPYFIIEDFRQLRVS